MITKLLIRREAVLGEHLLQLVWKVNKDNENCD